MTVTDVTTGWTADELEARDTETQPLVFFLARHGWQPVGQGVVVKTSDYCYFIGEVVDVDEDAGTFSVELS